MATNSSGSGRASINVTPLVDVLLVLLIIFMVIAPLTPKGLRAMAPVPPKNDGPATPSRTIVIQIGKDHAIRIDASDPIPPEMLGSRLKEIFKSRENRVAFVKGDQGLEYKEIAFAIDAATGAGIDKIGLITPKIAVGE